MGVNYRAMYVSVYHIVGYFQEENFSQMPNGIIIHNTIEYPFMLIFTATLFKVSPGKFLQMDLNFKSCAN